MIWEHQVRGKVSQNEVCNFLPHVGKEIPIKVEKDFTVLLATSGMVSNTDMCLCNSMKILEKIIRLDSEKRKGFGIGRALLISK